MPGGEFREKKFLRIKDEWEETQRKRVAGIHWARPMEEGTQEAGK